MLDRIRNLAERVGVVHAPSAPGARLAPLQAAAAQLLVATAAGTTLEQVTHTRAHNGQFEVPRPLTWAPVLIGPLAAAASLEHARRPTDRTATALRFLTAATIGFGGSIFLLDAIAHRDRPPTRLAPLAFASAGLLGLLIERQERRLDHQEKTLRRRAEIVERLVPRRKAKLDRIVVHV